mmetsp:Transcript_71498/g.158111  ORF Transcript_71498/g.158111 Transcript_71498/m.158111 type:complete len:215 (-) Transcript_71498:205-849(-)
MSASTHLATAPPRRRRLRSLCSSPREQTMPPCSSPRSPAVRPRTARQLDRLCNSQGHAWISPSSARWSFGRSCVQCATTASCRSWDRLAPVSAPLSASWLTTSGSGTSFPTGSTTSMWTISAGSSPWTGLSDVCFRRAEAPATAMLLGRPRPSVRWLLLPAGNSTTSPSWTSAYRFLAVGSSSLMGAMASTRSARKPSSTGFHGSSQRTRACRC